MKRCAERHRVDTAMRVEFPEPDDYEAEPKSTARRPSSAIACCATFRERYLTPEAAAVLKNMDPGAAIETCLAILKSLGFVVSLRQASIKRDRSRETAKRSEKRRIARAEKAALKAQIRAKPPIAAVSVSVSVSEEQAQSPTAQASA